MTINLIVYRRHNAQKSIVAILTPCISVPAIVVTALADGNLDHPVALADCVDHFLPFDYLTEDRVIPVQVRLR